MPERIGDRKSKGPAGRFYVANGDTGCPATAGVPSGSIQPSAEAPPGNQPRCVSWPKESLRGLKQVRCFSPQLSLCHA